MRWLAELDLLMAVDGYPSIADLRALRALNACDVSYWHKADMPTAPIDVRFRGVKRTCPNEGVKVCL
jgi:ketosteroid isomerase-like protein